MKKHIFISLMSAGLLAVSCSDNWDEHYGGETSGTEGAKVMEQLKSDPELSTFAQMVEQSGYASLLESTQTFTVFAPVNGALAGIDLDDKAAVSRTVANHIARFNISTATPAEEGVKMLNGKLMYFSNDGSFGGVKLVTGDIHTANGLLHKLSAPIPYSYNFREYIDTHSNTTSISQFLARFDEMLLPSQIPGYTGSGKETDPVSYNRLLQYPFTGLGDIASEDSVFSMVVPDNEAWAKAYEAIKPYFVTYNADPVKADSIQDVQTSLAIVNDLVYRTGLHDPLASDSLISTSGSVIHSPASFFSGMQHIGASNGRLYLANQLNYDMTETFNKPVRVEAEEATGRTTMQRTTVYTRNVTSDNPFSHSVSGQRYLEVLPTVTSANPGVQFPLPNVLAGTYDVYAVFVPAVVADETVTTEQTRLQFVINYLDANGRRRSSTFKETNFLTSPTEITVIRVAEAFKFPTANYYDQLWYMDPTHSANDATVTNTMIVQTNVSNPEFNRNELVRRFRIDRVFLVPVNAQ